MCATVIGEIFLFEYRFIFQFEEGGRHHVLRGIFLTNMPRLLGCFILFF